MTDWSSYGSGGSSSNSGGTDWSRYAGYGGASYGGSAPRSGGGGGFFGGLLGDLGAVAHPVENFLTGVGQGAYNIGHATVRDVVNHPYSLSTGVFAPLTANIMSFAEGGHGGHLVRDVAEPIGEAYAHKYAPVFEHPLTASSYRGIEHDPFGTALDALSLATVPFTGGESAVLRGGSLAEKLGMAGDLGTLQRVAQLPKAERAAGLAEAGRTGILDRAYVAATANRLPITRTAYLGGRDTVMEAPYTIDPARTPWGRWLQGKYHSVLEHPAVANTPVGAGRFVQREARNFVEQAQVPREQALHEFQRATPTRTPAHVAQQVAAEAPRGVAREDWLRQRIDFYKSQLDQAASKGEQLDLKAKLHQLGADNPRRYAQIQRFLTNPSPAFLNFYEKGRALSEETTRALGTPELEREARATLPADVFAGTRFQPGGAERVAGSDPFATDRAAMTNDARVAQTRLGQAQRRVASLQERVRSYEGRLKSAGENAPPGLRSNALRARKALDQARQDLQDAKTARDYTAEGVGRVPGPRPGGFIRTEGEFVGPHAGSPGAFAGYAKAAETTAENPFGENYIYSHLGPNRQALGGRAVLTRTNMPLSDSVKTPDVGRLNRAIRLTTGRYFTHPDVLSRAGVQAFRWATANDFRNWLLDYARAVPEDGRVPAGWRAVLDKPPRDVMDRQALLDHAMGTSAQKDALSEYWKRVLPKGDTTGAHLMVPESLARAVEREFQSNGALARVFDRATDAWRYSVLRLRPAWALRNIVSQHFLYHLHNLSPAGLLNLYHVMRPQWSPKEADTFARRLANLKSFRSQFGRQLEEAGVGGDVRHGSASLLRSRTPYGPPSRLSVYGERHPNVMAVPHAAKKLLLAPGNLNEKLNQRIADDLPRMAQFRRDLMRSPARARAQTRMLNLAKETDTGISLMRRLLGPKSQDVFREASPEELQAIARQGQRVLGNWASLQPWERRYVRRVIPFAQFFKTMTGIVTHLAADNPERVALLDALVKAAQQRPSILPAGAMPSWLQGSIALGAPQDGVQAMLDMQTANHFNAPAQFAQALGSLAGVGTPSDANGLLGPAADMLFYAEGINPTTGTTYKGTGSNLSGLPRAVVAELGGLPQVALAQQYLAGRRIPGTNERIGAPYPSQIYANSRYDNLLNYLLGPYKRVRLAKAAQYAQEGR